MVGDPWQRHGASQRARQLRARPAALSGLCLWYGPRPHHHAEICHPRSARHVFRRPSLVAALRLRRARRADARRRCVGLAEPNLRKVAAMKFTLAWLKDHLDTSASLAALTATLSAIGLEVEGVEDRGATLAAFSVARVLEAKPHPNADKLRVCKVETGHGIVEVVCGAPNART